MTEEYMTNICADAVDYYGAGNQILKAIEELGELQSALARALARAVARTSAAISACARDDILHALPADTNVMEEAADVQIMLIQLALMFDAEQFYGWIKKKLDRLESRRNEGAP